MCGFSAWMYSLSTKNVPQVMKEIGEVVRLIPQERMSERIVEQIVDIPVPQIVEEIMEVVQINGHKSAINSAPLNN